MSTSTPTKKKKTMAIQVASEDGSLHLVGIGNLRVVIVKDEDYWFAQGLEIDYAEQGTSLEDVKKNFENGLRATIDQYCKINGSIKNMVKPAPPEVWADVIADPSAYKAYYSQISLHHVKQLPFDGIQYLVAKGATASANG